VSRKENIIKTAAFAQELPGVEELDLLPYHRLDEPKYARFGREYVLSNITTLPPERTAAIRRMVENFRLRVRIGG